MPCGKAERCAKHALEGMVNVKAKRCETHECTIIAAYGVPGVDKRPRWCAGHCPPGAENLASKWCAAPGCHVTVYGGNAYCANHDLGARRRTRVRENQVANFLRDAGLHWTTWNKQLPETACGRYRPDFAYELPTHVVIVEVDEMQHARPGYGCDNARMLDVFGAYGGLPVVFIRFNPDAFALGGQTKRVWMHARMAALKKQLRAALDAPPRHALIITRLYYDQPDDRTVVTTCVDPTDPSFTERPV